MKLRTALKVCRQHYGDEPWLACRHRYQTQETAWRIGRRKLMDDRFPYVPSEDELQERGEVMVSLFAGLAKQMGAELPPELDDIAFDFDWLAERFPDEDQE